MRERSEQALRIVCLVLAGLLVLELGYRVLRRDPLAKLVIPPLPALTNAPDDQAKPANAPAQASKKSGTNTVVAAPGAKGTNVVSGAAQPKDGSNTAIAKLLSSGSNTITGSVSNLGEITTNLSSTNSRVVRTSRASNMLARAQHTNQVIVSSNSLADSHGTNAVASTTKGNTNLPPGALAARKGTNAPGHPEMAMAGMGPPGRPAPPKSLPAPIQARVDRIIDSELLGPVMRPLPMALLGIAGDVAFLRGPTGQTGLVKPGDKLGEIKLLEIGVNRVLVEEDGQKKELTIFSGYGSESLLPKTQDHSQ